jgi:hypothetical protein
LPILLGGKHQVLPHVRTEIGGSMNYKESLKVLGGLLDAFDRDEHGDYFYEHGWEVCEATILAYGALETQPFWISVEERLPERGVNVLCYMDFSKNEETKHWENSIADNVYNGVLVGSRPTKHTWAWQGDCVTHWMPLPEPPKED